MHERAGTLPAGSSPSSSEAGTDSASLPGPLRVIGVVSALAGMAAAIALAYLIATSEELFFGSPVAASDKTNYFVFAWVVLVVCGAQLVALVTNHGPRILASTIARLVTIIFPMFATPTFDFNVSIGIESLIQLAANLSIAATVLIRTQPGSSKGAPPADPPK